MLRSGGQRVARALRRLADPAVGAEAALPAGTRGVSKRVEVILQQDVKNLGSKGNTAAVKAGYFRNYLYPQRMAIYASKENLARMETSEMEAARERDNVRRDREMKQKQLQLIMTRLTSKPIEVKERTVEGGRALYGSVTARLICDAVTRQLNIDLPESRLLLAEPIKELGTYRVPLVTAGPGAEGAAPQSAFVTVLVKDAEERPAAGGGGEALEGEEGGAPTP
eukprot:jgi/Tetstr1/461057/TSEL_006204.t1